jgi:hypothetical protein
MNLTPWYTEREKEIAMRGRPIQSDKTIKGRPIQ